MYLVAEALLRSPCLIAQRPGGKLSNFLNGFQISRLLILFLLCSIAGLQAISPDTGDAENSGRPQTEPEDTKRKLSDYLGNILVCLQVW